jgi:drug/metabolite transporter (DMT)-like permease
VRLQVIAGWWMQQQASSGHVLRNLAAGKLAGGLALALLGTALLSAAMVGVQITGHRLSPEAVVWGMRISGLLFTPPLALAVGDMDWAWVTSLDALGWGVLILASVVVLNAGTLLLQVAICKTGAAYVAMFFCLRLVGAILGQLALPPHAKVTNPLAIAGVVLVVVVVSGFMGLQVWDARRRGAEAAAAAAQEQAQQQA